MTALLTNSRARAARSCARKHQLQYIQGWRPVEEAEALSFGTAAHAGLEAWWKLAVAGVQVDARLVAALEAVVASGLEPYARARLEAMLVGYHARWAHEPYELVAVEQTFQTDLVNPDTKALSKTWRLGGKLDVVVRHTPTGTTWLMEHKTSSEDVSPGSAYSRRLRMDSQVSIYFDGAAALGHQLEGCIYDVLSKPAQRPARATPPDKRKVTKDGRLYAGQRDTDETPEEYRARLLEVIQADPSSYFARLEVPRLEQELEDARRDLWQQAQRIREDERLGRAPRNPDACIRGSSVCPFFDVCTGAASLEDERLFRRLTDVHPELAGTDASNHAGTPKEVEP